MSGNHSHCQDEFKAAEHNILTQPRADMGLWSSLLNLSQSSTLSWSDSEIEQIKCILNPSLRRDDPNNFCVTNQLSSGPAVTPSLSATAPRDHSDRTCTSNNDTNNCSNYNFGTQNVLQVNNLDSDDAVSLAETVTEANIDNNLYPNTFVSQNDENDLNIQNTHQAHEMHQLDAIDCTGAEQSVSNRDCNIDEQAQSHVLDATEAMERNENDAVRREESQVIGHIENIGNASNAANTVDTNEKYEQKEQIVDKNVEHEIDKIVDRYDSDPDGTRMIEKHHEFYKNMPALEAGSQSSANSGDSDGHERRRKTVIIVKKKIRKRTRNDRKRTRAMFEDTNDLIDTNANNASNSAAKAAHDGNEKEMSVVRNYATNVSNGRNDEMRVETHSGRIGSYGDGRQSSGMDANEPKRKRRRIMTRSRGNQGIAAKSGKDDSLQPNWSSGSVGVASAPNEGLNKLGTHGKETVTRVAPRGRGRKRNEKKKERTRNKCKTSANKANVDVSNVGNNCNFSSRLPEHLANMEMMRDPEGYVKKLQAREDAEYARYKQNSKQNVKQRRKHRKSKKMDEKDANKTSLDQKQKTREKQGKGSKHTGKEKDASNGENGVKTKKKKKRNPRTNWTMEETAGLMNGYKEQLQILFARGGHKKGAKGIWSMIKDDPKYQEILIKRTGMQLKDKVVNLEKAGKLLTRDEYKKEWEEKQKKQKKKKEKQSKDKVKSAEKSDSEATETEEEDIDV